MRIRPETLPVGALTCGLAAAAFAVGFLVLAFRLKMVQVDGAADATDGLRRQSIRRVQTEGVRGRILDCRGRVLADNRPSVSIVLNAGVFRQATWDETAAAITNALAAVADVVGRPSPLTERDIRRHLRQNLARPLTVWRDVDADALARFEEQDFRLPGHSADGARPSGFAVAETFERTYPNGALAGHLLGYVGRDRVESPAGDEGFNFQEMELRGRSGVEFYYDGYLRGGAGESRLTVDARGFASAQAETVVPAQQGPDLTLTIDAAIQAACEAELQGLKGACVVLDAQSGAVRAMASAPSFNPDDFVPVLRRARYEAVSTDPAKPLLNRAVGGSYAPGSTFKPVTALAGLAAGHAADERHDCFGAFNYGGMTIRCARRWGHGSLDVREALRDSCNPFFCSLGVAIGTNALVAAARAFGLGAKTGIDFPVDDAGVVPDATWKMETYREKWYPGDVAQMSIGQGMLLVTPLQMARVAGALGTGVLVTPHLKADLPPERTPLPFDAGRLAVVREGLRMVVGRSGTGKRGAEGVAAEVIGKTGTAEVGARERRRKNTWFIAYAKGDRSSRPEAQGTEVAVALVVENGASGGETAAPKVCAILKAIFNGPDDGAGSREEVAHAP